MLAKSALLGIFIVICALRIKILQYMSLPPAATERNALVPVIATLLQLNAAEQKTVQNAIKAPMWASLPVKEVKPRSTSSSLFGSSVHENSNSPKYKSPDSEMALGRGDSRGGTAAVLAARPLHGPSTAAPENPLLDRCDDDRGASFSGAANLSGHAVGPAGTEEIHM